MTALQNTVAGLPNYAEVTIISNAGNLAQDSVNASIYATLTQNSAKADQSTTYTKTETDAAITTAIGAGWGVYGRAN